MSKVSVHLQAFSPLSFSSSRGNANAIAAATFRACRTVVISTFESTFSLPTFLLNYWYLLFHRLPHWFHPLFLWISWTKNVSFSQCNPIRRRAMSQVFGWNIPHLLKGVKDMQWSLASNCTSAYTAGEKVLQVRLWVCDTCLAKCSGMRRSLLLCVCGFLCVCVCMCTCIWWGVGW